MIKKELEIPLRLRKLEALIGRLSESHPKYQELSDEFGRRMSGYRGEQSLQYYLTFLNENNYFIFNNLRLPDISGEHFFELDILLISPTFLLIIDAKNYRGELYFDGKFDQLIQTYKDLKKSYHCPVAQINRHQLQLDKLLETLKFSTIPIETLVVFTNPNSIISASTDFKHYQKVIKSPSFLSKMELFKKRNREEKFDKTQLQKMSKLLLKKHTPHDVNILEQYKISVDELIMGVRCKKCGSVAMKRIQRKWYCPSCQNSTKTAYLDAIIDYYLLIGNTITNRKLREFLDMDSITASKNILLSLNLEYEGNFRNRVYKLPDNPWRIF
ncbi:nuclease-related domain-containing protein [Bacillus sp. JJ1562]|uniref:nuclease-related domain-containing protein n=1 Tax=Bacillus sp. JJ1562 TaxID=3122960 RepID=UPI003002AFA1